MITTKNRKKWFKVAKADFDIRHAGGGPFDEVDVINSFIRGCVKASTESVNKELLEALKASHKWVGTDGENKGYPYDKVEKAIADGEGLMET